MPPTRQSDARMLSGLVMDVTPIPRAVSASAAEIFGTSSINHGVAEEGESYLSAKACSAQSTTDEQNRRRGSTASAADSLSNDRHVDAASPSDSLEVSEQSLLEPARVEQARRSSHDDSRVKREAFAQLDANCEDVLPNGTQLEYGRRKRHRASGDVVRRNSENTVNGSDWMDLSEETGIQERNQSLDVDALRHDLETHKQKLLRAHGEISSLCKRLQICEAALASAKQAAAEDRVQLFAARQEVLKYEKILQSSQSALNVQHRVAKALRDEASTLQTCLDAEKRRTAEQQDTIRHLQEQLSQSRRDVFGQLYRRASPVSSSKSPVWVVMLTDMMLFP